MSRLFYHVMQDHAGNLLFDVTGTMRIAGSSTLATIYGDEAMGVILPNPMTNHPSFGSFKCYLGPGSYDFYMAKAGYVFETLAGVQGLGTMALQNAGAVNITGGTATLALATVDRFTSPDTSGEFQTAIEGHKSAGANRWNLYVPGTAGNYLEGRLGIGRINAGAKVDITYTKNTISGIMLQPSDGDTGVNAAIYFLNAAGIAVGGIFTSGTETQFVTTSDARLKHAVEALTGALAVITALRPVAFRWQADDSTGVGFLAHEVQQVVPEAVHGAPDAVQADGAIRPQQVDQQKLVPWLVGAVQELLARVVALETARP